MFFDKYEKKNLEGSQKIKEAALLSRSRKAVASLLNVNSLMGDSSRLCIYLLLNLARVQNFGLVVGLCVCS